MNSNHKQLHSLPLLLLLSFLSISPTSSQNCNSDSYCQTIYDNSADYCCGVQSCNYVVAQTQFTYNTCIDVTASGKNAYSYGY